MTTPYTEKDIKELKAKILEILEKTNGANILYCSKTLGISRTCIYYWRRDDKEFAEKVDMLCKQQRGSLVDMAETKLAKKIQDEDTQCIIFALKTLGKNRGYVEKLETEQTSYNYNTETSKEELEKIKNALGFITESE